MDNPTDPTANEEANALFFRQAVVELGLTPRLLAKFCEELTQINSETLVCYRELVLRTIAYCPDSINPELGRNIVWAFERGLCQSCERGNLGMMVSGIRLV